MNSMQIERNQADKINLLIVFIFTCLFIIPFIKKTVLSESIPFFSFIDEIFIIFLVKNIIHGYKKLFNFRFGRQVIICFLLFITLGSISGIINNIGFQQIIFQIALDFKTIFILLIFISVDDIQNLLQKFIKISKIISVLSIISIIWQYLLPHSYGSFFINEIKSTYLELPFNFGEIHRVAGIFWHPGQLALFGSFVFMYFIFSFYFNKNKKIIPWIFISGYLLIASCSRVEIAATFISIFFMLNIAFKKYGKIFQLVILSFLFTSLWPLINGFLQMAIEVHGIHAIDDADAARTVFYYNSVLLAKHHFPLGSGFGTFGGQAAVFFDSDLYTQLGFYQYYWYRARLFLTDTFWPHILGETGVIGTMAYLMMLIIIAARLLKQNKSLLKYQASADLLVSGSLACGAYGVLIINSLASANLSATAPLIYGFFFISVTTYDLTYQNLSTT